MAAGILVFMAMCVGHIGTNTELYYQTNVHIRVNTINQRRQEGVKYLKYILMCGGNYTQWNKPRQLININGEPIIARTIRLLRECGVDDISISSNDDVFNQFGVPVLKHDNNYNARKYNDATGTWCNGFYPTDYPVCYIFGDVIFSKAAIKTIVSTETDSIEFFASAPPFSPEYKAVTVFLIFCREVGSDANTHIEVRNVPLPLP